MLIAAPAAFSQEIRPIRLGLGVGLVAPQNTFPGFLLYAEPGWNINSNITLGFRLETIGRPNADVGIVGSYTLNGQYYFLSRSELRYFAGIGIGLFTPNKGLLASCTCEDESKANRYGFYPRVGFDYRHITFSIDYNIVQSSKQLVTYDEPMMMTTPEYYNARMSYLSFKFGVFIGGGRSGK